MLNGDCSKKSKALAISAGTLFACLLVMLLRTYHSSQRAESFVDNDLRTDFNLKDRSCFKRWSTSFVSAKEDRIFFHETSGGNFLYQKQLCTVESAAIHHPNRSIQVFFHTSSELNCHSSWAAVLRNYSNVELLLVDDTEFFAKSPFERWYESGNWRHVPHSTHELSEHARIVNLLRGPGVYMDLDFVVLRKLEETSVGDFLVSKGSKCSSLQSSTSVFQLSKDSQLFKDVVNYMKDSYDPNEIKSSLALAVDTAVGNNCKFDSNVQADVIRQCQNVSFVPYTSFFPFSSDSIAYMFGIMVDAGPLEKVRNSSTAVYYWDDTTALLPVLHHLQCPASILAKQYCPGTIAMAFRLLL